MPWEELAVDLIGPWTTINLAGQEITFNALACIDPVTNLVELPRINNKTAAHVAMKTENTRMARYPKPDHCCVHDKRGRVCWLRVSMHVTT